MGKKELEECTWSGKIWDSCVYSEIKLTTNFLFIFEDQTTNAIRALLL